MKKNELARQIQTSILATDGTQMSLDKIKQVTDAYLEIAYNAVANGDDFKVDGLGSLVQRQFKASIKRNPATGASIALPARTVVRFKVSARLKGLTRPVAV
jgi:DNA-binding protein HU-beta